MAIGTKMRTIDQEHADFEIWLGDDHDRMRRADGSYIDPEIQQSWLAWHARSQLQPGAKPSMAQWKLLRHLKRGGALLCGKASRSYTVKANDGEGSYIKGTTAAACVSRGWVGFVESASKSHDRFGLTERGENVYATMKPKKRKSRYG